MTCNHKCKSQRLCPFRACQSFKQGTVLAFCASWSSSLPGEALQTGLTSRTSSEFRHERHPQWPPRCWRTRQWSGSSSSPPGCRTGSQTRRWWWRTCGRAAHRRDSSLQTAGAHHIKAVRIYRHPARKRQHCLTVRMDTLLCMQCGTGPWATPSICCLVALNSAAYGLYPVPGEALPHLGGWGSQRWNRALSIAPARRWRMRSRWHQRSRCGAPQ